MTNTVIIEAFTQSVLHVLGAMTQSTPEPGEAFQKPDYVAYGDISAIVTVFDADKKIASVAVTFSREAAEAMATDALGELEDPENDTKEMVGEIMNIFSGDARRRLADVGLTLSGSTPSFILGSNHEIIHPTGDKTIAIPFTLPTGFCVIEFNFENFLED